MLLVLISVLAAAPCGENLECLAVAARTCGPTEGKTSINPFAKELKMMGIESTQVTTYRLKPGSGDECSLTFSIDTLTLKLAADARKRLKKDGDTDAQINAKEKAALIAANQNPTSNQKCLIEKDLLEKAFRGLAKGGYNSELWASCKPVSCPPPPVAAAGCTWSGCDGGERSLTCKKGKETFTCGPTAMIGEPATGCVLTCDANSTMPGVSCK